MTEKVINEDVPATAAHISPHFILHVGDGDCRPAKAVAIKDGAEVESEDGLQLPGEARVQH